MRVWRNWQTRKIQVLMVARLCRFKSCYPHQKKRVPFRGLAFFDPCILLDPAPHFATGKMTRSSARRSRTTDLSPLDLCRGQVRLPGLFFLSARAPFWDSLFLARVASLDPAPHFAIGKMTRSSARRSRTTDFSPLDLCRE